MTQSYPPPPLPPTYPPAPRNNGLAIASLILGVISLPGSFCCCCGLGFVPAVLAIIFGHLALSQINRSQVQADSRSLAIAGLITGYTGLALHILWILTWFLMAIFGQAGHPGMCHFSTFHVWP